MRFKPLLKCCTLLAIVCSVTIGTTKVFAQSQTLDNSMTSADASSSNSLNEEQKRGIFHSFINLAFGGKTKESYSMMDERMQMFFTEEKMEFVVKQLQIMFGDFKSVEKITVQKGQSADEDTLKAVCVFANKKGDATAIINKDGKLTSLFVKPHFDFLDPPYAKRDQFEEQEFEFPSGKLQIKATLSMPVSSGLHPCVVLVHGSGPGDRDETAGSIKVFRDVAWGLASNGIAVLRYEKRTRQYPHEPIKTVDDETVDDAIAAIQFLKTKSNVDPKKLFVLGHSLGALMAPEIAQREKDLAGVILCAGPTRKLEDIMVDQIQYIDSLKPDAANADHLNKIKEEVAAIKALDKNQLPSNQKDLLGAPATYWIYLQQYDPIKAAQSLTMPILIVQGDHDYQVTLEDFKGWQDGLKDKAGVTFKTYPGLGHTFTAASDKPSPSDYEKPSNVDETVIKDICDWIGQQK